MTEGVGVKPLPAISWTEASDREATLIAQCVAGDEAACTSLVAEHQRMVYQLAFHLLADHNEALDLSQEVFLQVFRTLPRFRGQSSLRTWIYRIVVNQARNRQRWWRRRHRASQVSLDEHMRAHGELPSQGTFSSPDHIFGRRQLASRLKHALLALPFDQRTTIVLREIDGLSYEEIAEAQGVAVGTVKSRLARARELLRAELREPETLSAEMRCGDGSEPAIRPIEVREQ
jgi:RNA polymerase sigma-70 factor, ECF subfamily